jgi:hypothetical protein
MYDLIWLDLHMSGHGHPPFRGYTGQGFSGSYAMAVAMLSTASKSWGCMRLNCLKAVTTVSVLPGVGQADRGIRSNRLSHTGWPGQPPDRFTIREWVISKTGPMIVGDYTNVKKFKTLT